ncbi:G-type lectin S-receptor-like serine/threonine-protein kinase SD3-1 [Arachis duranensis]|uniref:Receptor-like serine/threonine-protein kinase n=1 Tax=Arachis duranensis TaxID=130453 RepID=A0A6P5NBG9_ARADU|nr:G-type lectin S-receptor-like serine/threonine-protein kinase SD3-1 [Arachis duranensis]
MIEQSGLLLCVFICFLLYHAVRAEIPLGSRLSVVDNGSWVSKNGNFTIGFLEISDEPGRFSFGIRFSDKSIPYSQQRMVWSADFQIGVGNMSYFLFTTDGDMLLFDDQGISSWSSQTSNKGVVSASLLDNGNLVLIDREQKVIWQSFDSPYDTLLPGQFLSCDKMLQAASTNLLSSYYSLSMNVSGHLMLLWQGIIPYWTSQNPSVPNLTAYVTNNGALQLLDKNLNVVWTVFGEDYDEYVKYRFLRIDVDGNLRLYSWVEALQSWKSVRQAVQNQCKVFATCGKRGVCVLSSCGTADCVCPFNQTDTDETCLIPYEQKCKHGSTMITYRNIHLFGLFPIDGPAIMTSMNKCMQLCQNDSSCTAATFSNHFRPQCSIKKSEYVTGYLDWSPDVVSFVKSCSSTSAPKFPCQSQSSPPTEEDSDIRVPCLIGISLDTIIIAVVLQLGCFYLFIYKRKTSTRCKYNLPSADTNLKGLVVLLSFSEIKSVTEDFKDRIGPNMFKGMLLNKFPVAVKELIASIDARKFRTAVLKIGGIHHKNLVQLEGYCCESNHRFLVYEYVKNGSLEKYIDDSALCKELTWRKRVDICLSVAQAINYLHSECREFISHGNLKCENVMLDENLKAKVSECGFAIVDGEAVYCAFSAQRDIADFGMLVLTLLTGCRDQSDLCEWSYKELIEGNAANVIDKRIEGGANLNELERVLRIAFWCLQSDERRRPSMEEVVAVLEGTLSIDLPPPPF